MDGVTCEDSCDIVKVGGGPHPEVAFVDFTSRRSQKVDIMHVMPGEDIDLLSWPVSAGNTTPRNLWIYP